MENKIHRVLVLEDSDFDYKLLMLSLGAIEGISITWVTTPEEGMMVLEVEKYNTSNGIREYDLLISDGKGWDSCIEKGLGIFGKENVIVLTGDERIIREMEANDVSAFMKPLSKAVIEEVKSKLSS